MDNFSNDIMNTRINLLSTLVLSILVLWSTPSLAQRGTLDNSFGINGKVTTSIGTVRDNASALVIQNDKKIVVGGTTASSFTSTDFAVLRYLENGSLDSSFGNGGKVVTSIENRSAGHSMALQNDGKILLGGTSKRFINLLRLHPNGDLDTNFGTSGSVVADMIGFYNDKCRSIAVQNDGKILVGGYSQHNSNDQSTFFLLRYLSDGTPDSTFGINGVVIGGLGECHAIAVQTDGKIVMAGSTKFEFSLERYLPDGSPDSSFGTNGKSITPFGSSAKAFDLDLQSDGKIVLCGFANFNNNYVGFVAARYLTDGSLDNSFGTAGVALADFGKRSQANAVRIQTNGKIVLAGEARDGSDLNQFALARFLSDGSLDQAFANGGMNLTNFDSSHSAASCLGLHADGRIVAGGTAPNSVSRGVALVRFNGDGVESGTAELCCGPSEIRTFPNPFSTTTTIQLSQAVQNASLVIYDSKGRTVSQQTGLSGEEFTLSRSSLPAGIYYLQVREQNQVVAKVKLVISDQ